MALSELLGAALPWTFHCMTSSFPFCSGQEEQGFLSLLLDKPD